MGWTADADELVESSNASASVQTDVQAAARTTVRLTATRRSAVLGDADRSH